MLTSSQGGGFYSAQQCEKLGTIKRASQAELITEKKIETNFSDKKP